MNITSTLKRHAMGTLMGAALTVALFGAPFTGQANPLANDATVLNYLVEMERQGGKGCGNETVKLPSLVPSPDIQELADIIATSNTTLDELLTLRGMDKSSVFSAFVHASNAQEAVNKLRLANCPELLNANYSQIGSNHHGTKWTVVLAGEQRIPATKQSSDIIVNPYEPTETSPQGSRQDTAQKNVPAAAQSSVQESAPAPTQPAQDQTTRQTHGKYADGEPVFLPEKNENREPATPQVTGVYTDDTLTPVNNGQSTPPAVVAPAARQPQLNQQGQLNQQTPALRPQQPPLKQPANQQPAVRETAPQQQSAEPAPPANAPRKTFGKYGDGEPVFLPEKDEHREPATPQVTGVYTDDTLTPQQLENQSPPPAPLAPAPEFSEPARDPNDAAPPQPTGIYTP